MALPGLVLERLLQEADGIFAMAACPCRTAFQCKLHPWELGCLHLGPATWGIPAELGRHLTLAEGLAVLESALTEGLVPTILHMPSEAEIFKVDGTQMLSVCFCCECCCDVRLLLREGPDRYWEAYNQRLPGLEVKVNNTCTGCGECLTACYGGERVITILEGQAWIGERCLGCGKCVEACPVAAISLQISPQEDFIESLLEKINQRVRLCA